MPAEDKRGEDKAGAEKTVAERSGADKAGEQGPSDDVKRKFREALDRKHAHGKAPVSDGGDHAKIHGAHGPAKAQQMFRRKSGG